MTDIDKILESIENIHKQIKVMSEILRIEHLIEPTEKTIEELTDPDA
jgi:hypothetical protein